MATKKNTKVLKSVSPAGILTNNKYKNTTTPLTKSTYQSTQQFGLHPILTKPSSSGVLKSEVPKGVLTSTKKEPLQEYKTTTSSSSSSGGGSSSSYTSTVTPYLNAMISAYQQGADANKANAKMVYDTTIRDLRTALDRAQASYDTGVSNANQNYETTRGNLLTSLKRFQEENAKNVENQKRAYITDQAALEAARLEADRQTRINNTARGLGGSGLQQLAQLQNLISQGQDISNLAASNQSEMDALRTQMTQAQEDYNTDLAAAEQARNNTVANLLTVLNNAKADTTTGEADALATYNAALQGIEANLANQIADANYNFGQNAYSASRAASSNSNDSNDSNLNVVLKYYQDDLADSLSSIKNADNKTLKTLKETYGLSKKASNSDLANAMVKETLGYGASTGLNENQYNIFNSNLKIILKNANIK